MRSRRKADVGASALDTGVALSVLMIGLLVLGGLAIGTLGTLIGAGGGFILMPILVMAYPGEGPERLTAISLAVVFANALSGTIGYAKRRRVDFRSGLIYAAASVPGALVGTWINALISRSGFDVTLGLTLIALAVFLLIRGAPKKASKIDGDAAHGRWGPRVPHTVGGRSLGVGISFAVGFIASLLGIGGGIIHVPLLVFALGFPVHIAAATSHFVLCVTSGVATGAHAWSGDLWAHWEVTVALAAGVVVGAQIGAALSNRVPAGVILRCLAAAMIVAGGRVVWMAVVRGPSHSQHLSRLTSESLASS